MTVTGKHDKICERGLSAQEEDGLRVAKDLHTSYKSEEFGLRLLKSMEDRQDDNRSRRGELPPQSEMARNKNVCVKLRHNFDYPRAAGQSGEAKEMG